MKIQKSFESEFTVESIVDRLLFAELMPASERAWWRDMALGQAWQELPRHEYFFVENLYSDG
jgi:hypothetical protein